MADFDKENVTSGTETAATEAVQQKKAEESARLEIYDWIQCIVSALVVGILVFIFVARVITVDGTSMLPTLKHTDKVVTSKLFYKPEAGDIIVFQTEKYGESPLVKRLIATEGQTVDIDFDLGIVYVDGVALDEPYTNSPTNDRENFSGPVTVPEGQLFVLGDNRNASSDSRSDRIGLVDERCIIGKVYFVIIPGFEGGKINWSRIGSVYN